MGWKLEELSERCGVEVGTISAIENRDSDRSAQFIKIAPAFGLTVEKLADVNTDHVVYDARARAAELAAATQPPAAKEEGPDIYNEWTQKAMSILQRVHPDHRDEVLCFLEWQVARRPRPQSGKDLPMAA